MTRHTSDNRASLTIRQASAEDSEALAELAARTFRDTFEKDNTPADMAAYLEESFHPERVAAELAEPANTFLLAVLLPDDPPIGYVKLRDGTPDPSVRGPAPIELERLYVGRAAIGHGVGAALMQASLDRAAQDGFQTLWLGVWEENEHAIAFYRKWQFEEVGVHDFLLGSDRQTDLIFERPARTSERH